MRERNHFGTAILATIVAVPLYWWLTGWCKISCQIACRIKQFWRLTARAGANAAAR